MKNIDVIDLEPAPSDFRKELREGLRQSPKTLPPKFLYDERGSELFEAICKLDDYYPTRTELGIMERHIDAMAEIVGPRARIVEFGAGSGKKTRMLLEHLKEPTAYLPIEISPAALRGCARRIREQFPGLEIMPVVADYTQTIDLPVASGPTEKTVAYFPGSTIGNFTPDDAVDFLSRIQAMCADDGGGVLIGADLDKSADILERAYDDSEGVTAEFNLNVLRRANRELDTDFDLEAFEHRAVYDPERRRIEMQLVSQRDQTVHLGEEAFEFADGEPLVTEHSHKFIRERFETYAERAGLTPRQVWTDPDEMFSIWYLEA